MRKGHAPRGDICLLQQLSWKHHFMCAWASHRFTACLFPTIATEFTPVAMWAVCREGLAGFKQGSAIFSCHRVTAYSSHIVCTSDSVTGGKGNAEHVRTASAGSTWVLTREPATFTWPPSLPSSPHKHVAIATPAPGPTYCCVLPLQGVPCL